MIMAARQSLDLPMTFEDIDVELRLFEGWALRALFNFRILYRDSLILFFKYSFDVCTGPSKFWFVVPGRNPHCGISSCLKNLYGKRAIRHAHDPIAPRTEPYKPENGELITPGVPAWLHDLFTEGVGGIGCIADDLVGVSTLGGPSDIRIEYLFGYAKARYDG